MADNFDGVNFVLNNFPKNDMIEVPDSTNNKKKMPKSPEDMLEQLMSGEGGFGMIKGDKDSMMGFLQQILGGIDPEQMKNLNISIGSLGNKFPMNEYEDDESDSNDDLDLEYTLSIDKSLNKEDFAIIPCNSSDDFFERLTSKYGDDPNEYLDTDIFENIILNDMTKKLPIKDIIGLNLIEHNDKFAVYSTIVCDEDNEEEIESFFVAILDTPTGFRAYIPSFGNLFAPHKDGHLVVYNIQAPPPMVSINDCLELFKIAVEFSTVPVKNPLMCISDFGTVKNLKVPITEKGDMLQIGEIRKVDSDESQLFIEDMELPKDQEKFPIFIKFKQNKKILTLKVLQEIFFKVDFNSSIISKFAELKVTPNKELYIELNF